MDVAISPPPPAYTANNASSDPSNDPPCYEMADIQQKQPTSQPDKSPDRATLEGSTNLPQRTAVDPESLQQQEPSAYDKIFPTAWDRKHPRCWIIGPAFLLVVVVTVIALAIVATRDNGGNRWIAANRASYCGGPVEEWWTRRKSLWSTAFWMNACFLVCVAFGRVSTIFFWVALACIVIEVDLWCMPMQLCAPLSKEGLEECLRLGLLGCGDEWWMS